MSDTPRTDAIWAAQDKDGFHDIDEVWDHARKLEREIKDLRDEQSRSKMLSSAALGAMCEGMHNIMQRGSAGCQHEWRGPGEMPRRYTCGCGTVVFRSREDAD